MFIAGAPVGVTHLKMSAAFSSLKIKEGKPNALNPIMGFSQIASAVPLASTRTKANARSVR
jgi:hypothetical protein